MHAIINNAIPKPNLGLLSSNIPEITNKNAKNPKITGKMWENIVVPTTAIINHYIIYKIIKLYKLLNSNK